MLSASTNSAEDIMTLDEVRLRGYRNSSQEKEMFMLFQTHMTLFIPWNTKGYIFNNVPAALLHADTKA